MKMKLMKNKQYLQQAFSQKKLQGQQELCPFYM